MHPGQPKGPDGSTAIDVYTGKPIVTHSEEHILLRSLGGRISKVGILDKVTNDQFGRTIDASINEALRAIRVITDAKNSDKKSPKALTGLVGDDGKKYTVEAGGIMRQAPQLSARKLASGEMFIEGSIPDRDALRNMLRNYARRSGSALDDLVERLISSAHDRVEAPPELTFGVELWDANPYRATAKMACNLLAFTDAQLFLDSAFDEIRQFVLLGAQPDVHPVQAVDVEVPEPIGELDHLVRVDVRGSGEVSALVVYFGHLAFVVRLAVLPPRKPIRLSYRVDQLRSTDRINDSRDLSIAVPPFALAAARSHAEFEQLVVRSVNRVLFVARRIQHRLWIKRIVTKPYQEFLAEAGDAEPTEEQAWAFSSKIADLLVKELAPSIQRASLRRREAASALHTAERGDDGDDGDDGFVTLRGAFLDRSDLLSIARRGWVGLPPSVYCVSRNAHVGTAKTAAHRA